MLRGDIRHSHKQRVEQNCSNYDTLVGYRIWSHSFEHPVLLKRGKLDIKEYGKMSTRFDDNEGNIEMLPRVNQISIYGLFGKISAKTVTKTHPQNQLTLLTEQNAQEHYAREVLEMRRNVMHENARCSLGGNRTNSDTDTSTTSAASTTKSPIRRRRKASITLSIARLDGGTAESHGETRQQCLHLHLQHRSGRLRNGKRVGAHGNQHQLRNGGDFGFLEGIPENRRTRLVQELHSIVVITFCCSLTCRLLRAHRLPHSLLLLPRQQNTHLNRDNTIYSKNTRYIINLSRISQSTSGASGVKTCRAAETRARHSPQ